MRKHILITMLLIALLAAPVMSALAEDDVVQIFKEGYEAWQSGDYEWAAARWTYAAGKGNADAAFNVGIMYQNGMGVEQSFENAAKYYQIAADQGIADAQYALACLYNAGTGVEQSYEKAAEYFRLAADQGHSDAQYNLGFC